MNWWQRVVQYMTGGAEVKAISHRPDLAGRQHVYTSTSYDVPADMSEFLGYATVYASYVWAAKAVNKIVDNFVGLPVRVVDTEAQPLDSHPLSILLAHVNDEETPADLWSAYIVHKLLGGEAFTEIVPDSRGRPAELWIRRPDWMLVRPDITRLDYPRAAEYVYQGESGAPVTLPAEFVIHDKFYNPLQPWRGLAPIAAVREGITIDLFSQTWSKSFIRNNARPDFALVAPQGITPTERDRYLSEFLRSHQGADNAHLPVILEDGITDIKTFSFAPKDMEWLEQRRFSRDEVGAIFGVPDEIMGYGKDTYENFQTALEVFWTLTLRPLVLRRDLTLTNHFRKTGLLRPSERVGTDLSDVGVLQEDVAPKIAMAVQLWERGVPWNVLDERFGLGIGAIPGGDVGYVPTGMTPVERVALELERARRPQPEPQPAQEPPESDAMPDEMDSEEERSAEMRRLRAWAKKRKHVDVTQFASTILSDADKLAVLGEAATAQDFFTPEALKARLLELAPDDEEAQHALRMALERRSAREIAAALAAILAAHTPRDESEFEIRRMAEEIERDMRQDNTLRDALLLMLLAAAALGVAQAEQRLILVGISLDSAEVELEAQAWADTQATLLANQMADTTRRGVTQAAERWLRNGLPLAALLVSLEPLFGKRRGQTVAATEITRALTQAGQMAYRAGNVVQTWQWITQRDEKTCSICRPRHGLRAPLGQPVEGLIPPAHINCRCHMAPVAD